MQILDQDMMQHSQNQTVGMGLGAIHSSACAPVGVSRVLLLTLL